MRKYISIISILLIIPSVAFASWWNPLSWGIFSALIHSNEQVKITNIATSSNRVLLATSTHSVVKTTESTVPISVYSVETEPSPAAIGTTSQITAPIPKETKADLMSKMGSLQQGVESIIKQGGIQSSDPSGTELYYIDTKISEDISNLNLENYPSDQDIGYFSSQYNYLESDFNSLPPIIYSVSNGQISTNTVISGYGFLGATSVYIMVVNPGTSDVPINLPFNVTDNYTIDINLSNVYITAGQYDLYVLNSTGKKNAPLQTSVSTTQTPESEQTISTSASNSLNCQTAEQELKLAIQDNLASLQQTYIKQVQFYCSAQPQ
jgi:hypothetical protein